MNPLAGNPLRTRADLQQAVRQLCGPVLGRLSPGRARARLGVTGAVFDNAAAELEGFARPLWGLVPLAAGGGAFDGWDTYRAGLAAGTDPTHPEYWGLPAGRDQRLVEMAAIGLGLALVPDLLWDPLPATARANLAGWLATINERELPNNNWYFFRVLVNLGLATVDATPDLPAMHAALDRLESYYLGDGWYSDGPVPQRDYYIAFAMHFYGLIYARLAGRDDPQRADRFRQRAAAFAHDFVHWFAADGAALPFGRSLTYRFAQGGFWGALAYAGVDALPWGVVKGLALRHLRWWAGRPIWHPDGTLSIGYAYPNLTMAEAYNSPGSPYWALKFFLPLALPADHPFWQADEEPLPDLPATHPLPHAGMVMSRSRHVVALASGQHAAWFRHGAEKYAKFAYSTAFGFSVPSGRYGLEQAACDSMLALAEDGVHYRPREDVVESRLDGDVLRSQWQPWPDVRVDTWLVPAGPWHLRIHRLRTGRTLHSAEGGFAIEGARSAGAVARGPAGASGVMDLAGDREGQVVNANPNTNLLFPRTVIPVLIGRHEKDEHWLACAVLADPDPAAFDRAWVDPPELPAWFHHR